MNTITLSCTSLEYLENKIKETLSTNFYPTIGIGFVSHKYDAKTIMAIFNRFKIDLLACTSSGEFTESGITQDDIAFILMDLDKESYRMYLADSDDHDIVKWGEETAKFGKQHFKEPAFLSLLDLYTCGDFFIEGIQKVSTSAKIFGGLAAVENTANPVHIIVNDQISTRAVGSLILDTEKVEVNGEAISGWKSVGTLQTITKCDGNKIMEINGEPALSYFNKIVGTYHQGDEIQDGLMLASFQYPLQIVKGDESILRAPIISNTEENSIVVAGKVNEGDQFKFSYAPGITVVKDTLDNFKVFAKQHEDIDAAIIFNCKARQAAFGPIIEEEIKGIQQLWNKPMVGFFSFGEIGRNKSGNTYLYNETCSIVTLKEK